MKKIYITTPLYYANADLHIGHAYSTIAADVLKRWHSLSGREVFFLTGMDEHGEKIYRSATAAGRGVQEWVDEMAVRAKKLWKFLNISYDDFIRTTEPRHTETVRFVFSKLIKSGDIYPGVYEGPYCIHCESFYTENQVREAGGNCPECGRPITKIKKEEAFFFRLSKYREKLLEHYEKNPEFLSPRDKANKTIDTVKRGLKDLCITRQTVKWGIPIPEDSSKTIYVWFDALINYISAAGFPADMEKFSSLWPADCHIVGKEIFYFHTVIWPAILMALGLPLPRKVFGHGWWTLRNDKISKSKGNIITPYEICERFHSAGRTGKGFCADVLRFFFLREMPFGTDGAFSVERVEERYNSDLANSLGNLFRRVEEMIRKYFGMKTPSSGEFISDIIRKEEEVLSQVDKFMGELNFFSALGKIWELINEANRFVEEAKPWVLFKEKNAKLNDVMITLVDVLFFISHIISPFMPGVSDEMFRHLGGKPENFSPASAPRNRKISGGEVLFPKFERLENGVQL